MTTTIYSARRILTMNPRRPVATHVAVRDGHVLGAGALDELAGWGEYELDERFAGKVLMPGFVEGHCHSWEGSAWEDTYLGFFDRTAPDGVLHPGLKSIDEVVERFRAAAASAAADAAAETGAGLTPGAGKSRSGGLGGPGGAGGSAGLGGAGEAGGPNGSGGRAGASGTRGIPDPSGEPGRSGEAVMGWGFDPIFFGGRRMVAADLDRVSATRPVIVMHQSGHIVNVNSEALRRAGITRDTQVQGLVRDAAGAPTGELQGPALRSIVYRAAGRDRFLDMGRGDSLWRFAASARRAGVTTATDLANELPEETVASQVAATANEDFPLRIVPAFFAAARPADEGVAWVKSLIPRSHERLRYGLVKLVVDGSIQGFTARLKWPGYYNGHENGLWYVEPNEELPRILGTFHRAGLQVHIHTNGDEATEAAIDAIEAVLRGHPDADARFTLQHCQMAHDAHFRRMARLGICANLFANHLYYWGDQHHALTMGPERAGRMDAAGSAKRLGVPFSIHSDAPVTHLAPLFTAWCAVNRTTASGRVLGEAERLTVPDALHAITLGAAFTLKLDTEIGSIEAGKRADFAILEDDPLAVDPAALKEVAVWGTVVGGRVFPNPEPEAGAAGAATVPAIDPEREPS